MLNGYDRINVRLGNQRRKRALQKLGAARFGVPSVMRAGGGLGRSRANQGRFPFLRGKMNDLVGLGRGGFNQFYPAEFQPSAPDPGAGSQGDGVSGTTEAGGGYPYGNDQQAWPTQGGGGAGPAGPGAPPPEFLGGGLINQAPATPPDGTVAQVPGAAGQMVWYQGQLIPSGVYQALIRGTGGF